jgi:hypothetical protein
MYTYKALIFAHYQKEPVALAIITDRRPANEPTYYSRSGFGMETVYRYNNLVLMELDDDELISSDNPIDLVFYAAKCSLRSKGKEFQKYSYLRETVGLLGERGWSRDDKRDLLLFIERILYLKDEKLGMEYSEYRQQLKKEGKIVFIPIGEQKAAREIEQRGIAMGMEKGRAKGIEEGKEEVARNLLANGISTDVIVRSTGLPLEQIRGMMN